MQPMYVLGWRAEDRVSLGGGSRREFTGVVCERARGCLKNPSGCVLGSFF